MINDTGDHDPGESERLKALRDAARAVCTYCANDIPAHLSVYNGSDGIINATFHHNQRIHAHYIKEFVYHSQVVLCPATGIHDLIAQELAAAAAKEQ